MRFFQRVPLPKVGHNIKTLIKMHPPGKILILWPFGESNSLPPQKKLIETHHFPNEFHNPGEKSTLMHCLVWKKFWLLSLGESSCVESQFLALWLWSCSCIFRNHLKLRAGIFMTVLPAGFMVVMLLFLIHRRHSAFAETLPLRHRAAYWASLNPGTTINYARI